MSSIQKRKGIYYYRYRDLLNVQHNLSLKTGDVVIAERRKEIWDQQVIQYGKIDRRNLTLRDLFDLYSADCLKDKSEKRQKELISHFSRFSSLEGKKIDSIRQSDIEKVISDKKTCTYKKKLLWLFRNMVTYAMSKNYLFQDVTQNINIRNDHQTHHRKDDYLTVEQTQTFFEVARQYYPDYEPMFRLTYLSGMRLGETRLLEWSDVDISNKRILFPPSKVKSRTNQIVVLNDRAIDLLNSLQKDSKYVFPNRYPRVVDEKGGLFPYSEKHPARVVKKVFKRMGMNKEQIAGHIFRKSFISHLVQNGANPKEVQELARHASIDTTMRYYARLSPDHLQDALSRLPDFSNQTYS